MWMSDHTYGAELVVFGMLSMVQAVLVVGGSESVLSGVARSICCQVSFEGRCVDNLLNG